MKPLRDEQPPAYQSLSECGVPDSVAAVLKARGHVAILHREALPDADSDTVVCATALENDAILVALDGDMKSIAKRFGMSHDSDRFFRPNLIRICCNEVLAAKRLEQAILFIEHKWAVSETKVARRLWLEIGPHPLKTNR